MMRKKKKKQKLELDVKVKDTKPSLLKQILLVSLLAFIGN